MFGVQNGPQMETVGDTASGTQVETTVKPFSGFPSSMLIWGRSRKMYPYRPRGYERGYERSYEYRSSICC